jgi:hypothetical protein
MPLNVLMSEITHLFAHNLQFFRYINELFIQYLMQIVINCLK